MKYLEDDLTIDKIENSRKLPDTIEDRILFWLFSTDMI